MTNKTTRLGAGPRARIRCGRWAARMRSQPRRGAALVDVRRRVRGRQGTGQRLHRRPAAPGSTRPSPAASRRARPPSTAWSAATPPTAAQFNTSKQFLDLVDQGMLNNVDVVAAKNNWDKILPAPILNVDQDQGPLLRGAGGHPHARVVLVFEGRVRQGRHRRRAEDARRVLRRPRQAQGRRHRAARLRRPAVAGEDHVLRVARARRRPRDVHEAVPRQGRRDGGVAAVQGAA